MNSTSGHFIHRLWKIALYCFLTFPLALVAAHAPDFTSRTWQTEDGLPHNTVQSIAQTPDGYLWIGTRAGLARFDGIRFVVFDPGNTSELKSRNVNALCVTRDGSLWIGVDDDGGLTRLKDGTFRHYGRTAGLAGESIKTLFEGFDGTLWVGTRTGISLFKNEQFTPLTIKEGFTGTAVTQFFADRENRMWIVSDAGLHRNINGELKLFPLQDKRLHPLVRGLEQDHDGNLWLATMIGMARLNEQGVTYFMEADGLAEKVVLLAYEDKNKNLWAGTSGGLYRFDEARFSAVLNHEGEAFDQANAIFEDREGNLWVGAKDGLSRLRLKQFSTFTRKEGLSGNNAMSVFEDDKGSVWVTTWGGGLNEIKKGKVIVHDVGKRAGLESELFLSVTQTRDGLLWVGADFDGGLLKILPDEVQRFDKVDFHLVDYAIRVLCEDREGNLWLGTRTALVKWQGQEATRFTTGDGLAGNFVQAICVDHEGTLWIGTDNGLSRYREGRFTNYRRTEGLSDTQVTAIYEDAARVLWIGTRSGGLNRFENGKFTACSKKDGLFEDHVFEILEDDNGFFWMSSLKGIFRVNKRELNDFLDGKTSGVVSVSFGKSDGMASTQCNGVGKPGAYKSKDGRLWFVTTKGVVVAGSGTSVNSVPPTVVVESVMADKKKVPSFRNTFEIPPGRGELEFHFTALSLTAPEKNRFKYMLEGLDADWIEAGDRRVAYYNNVEPGNYTFRVIACNNDSVWNSLGASVKLDLQPHFWQTLWFHSAIGLVSFVFVGGTARFVTRRKMQHKLAQLEQQHAIERERARIAQDMHDDLGARLTEILMLSGITASGRGGKSGMKANAEKVVGAAEDMVRNMDGLVWAINPRNDSLKQLTLYFYEYVQRFLGATNIRSRWEVPQNLPDVLLTADIRHNLFLLLKEALNNVVKHSKATEVSLHLMFSNNELSLGIEDNGCGLCQTPSGRIGHGLSGMEKRTEDLGGRLNIVSEPGKGTRVETIIPLTQNGAVRR